MAGKIAAGRARRCFDGGVMIGAASRVWTVLVVFVCAVPLLLWCVPVVAAVDQGTIDPAVIAAGDAQAAKLRAFWSSAAAKAQIQSSQAAFSGESDSAAEAADAKAFPQVDPLPLNVLRFGGKLLQVTREDNPTVLSVSGAGGSHDVLSSTVPLYGNEADGSSAPIDLTLLADGLSYRPTSALVPVTIPKNLTGAVSFPGLNLDVHFQAVGGLVPAAGVTGAQNSGSVIYPNASTIGPDTDALVTPDLTGADLSWVLRSPLSPQQLSLGFDLQPGWTLAKQSDGSVAILDASGQQRATVMPPFAQDAIGQAVPTSYTIQGTILKVNVTHRTGLYVSDPCGPCGRRRV